MKQFKFTTHEEYVEAQRVITLRKLGRAKSYSFTEESVAAAIAVHWNSLGNKPVEFGICHGVLGGLELGIMKNAMGGEWLGTDIVPEACRIPQIVCHDFHCVRQDWVAHFDVIYSNALDHARFPNIALRAWQCSLKPYGCLYVEWTAYHNKLSRHGTKSDCFAADKDEYLTMLLGIGRVEEFTSHVDGVDHIIFAVR